MLDTQGISIDEIKHKYPKTFQFLGYDVLMDVDSAYKPKVISSFEMCINSIQLLLFMKPGQYPSIPELGIDIESYLHEYSDDNNVCESIKTKLTNQCNRLDMLGISIDVYFERSKDNNNALIIEVTGTDRVTYGSDSSRVIIGITYDKLNRLYAKKYYI